MKRNIHPVALALISSLLLAFGSSRPAFPQSGIITTIAGGGTNGPSRGIADIGNPTCIAIDAAGDIYFGSLNLHQVFKLDFRGNLTVVAGTGSAGYSGDDGPATEAALSSPMGVAVDQRSNLFISDTFNGRVRRVDALTGIITTVAGNGKSSRLADDGEPATDVSLGAPAALALDARGGLFISENWGERIRRVDGATGIITTVAGTGERGFSGDGGPATSAMMGPPDSLAVDAHGNLFLSDMVNNRIRRVDAETGIITTVAGNGSSGDVVDGGPATSASLNWPRGLAVDESGNILFADTNNNRLRRVDAKTGIITTVAGNGRSGFGGEGESATSASISPSAVAVDRDGNLFIADAGNHRILRVDGKSGTLNTLAGGGNGGDNGPATEAILAGPSGVATDNSGNVFIAEEVSGRIRRIDATSSVITTVAGNGTETFSGDGGPATAAGLGQASAVAVDAQGDLFIADPMDGRIRRVDAQTGVITTVAGGGRGGDGVLAVDAQIGITQGVAVDAQGNIFIPECLGNRVRRVDHETGIITTVAGGRADRKNIGDGGPATSASLIRPWRVAVDSSGNLFIADVWGGRIRRVDAKTGIITTVSKDLYSPQDVAVDAQGNVFIALGWNNFVSRGTYNRILRVDAVTWTTTTVAGDGTHGFSGDGGPATSASLGGPQGIAVDPGGRLLIADTGNNRVRAVDLPPFAALSAMAVSFPNQRQGTASAPEAVTLTNTGPVPLNISGVAFEGADAGDYAQAATCSGSLKPGAHCEIKVTFTPAEAGLSRASLVITDDATDSPQKVSLSGTGAAANLSAGSSPQ
jgi:trimeric autotransporter adhesin